MRYAPQPLHIPDGFLSVTLSIILWIISAIVVSYALKRVGRELGERQVPLMGVLAAAIFAGQMLNFTIVGGTSGHLMGAAIATILLGPWGAILVLTCVVSVQALIFQDGGLLALGANIFNMGVIGVSVSYMAYSTLRRFFNVQRWKLYVGGFIAAWLSIETAALATALELAISGTSPANIAIPAMGGVHALIGIGEGLITIGALAFFSTSRRGTLEGDKQSSPGSILVWITGLALALGLAIASPLASSNPDGLERVAQQQGFLNAAKDPLFNLIPGYLLPGIQNQGLATILAGIIGTLLVFGMALAVAYLRRTRRVTD